MLKLKSEGMVVSSEDGTFLLPEDTVPESVVSCTVSEELVSEESVLSGLLIGSVPDESSFSVEEGFSVSPSRHRFAPSGA